MATSSETTAAGTRTVTALGGEAVAFNEEQHTYSLDNGVLSSVGEVVKSVSRPFDAEYHADRMAAKRARNIVDRTEEKFRLLQEWADKRDAACARGKALHAYVYGRLRRDRDPLPNLLPEAADLIESWERWWAGAQSSMRAVAVEQVLVDKEWKLAGTCDALFHSAKTGLLHVFDWKQNERYATTSLYGDRMLEPFSDLDDCEHVHHSMQLSLYRLMVERSKVCRPTGDGYVLHLRPGVPAEAYRCLDLRERLAKWMDGRVDEDEPDAHCSDGDPSEYGDS